MRILIVGENHREAIRGRTIAIHGLARALRDRGHDVTLWQAALPEHRIEIDGIRTRYVSTTRKSLYPIRFGALSTRGYDVVHTHDEAGAYLALRSRLQRFPLVAQIQPMRVKPGSFLESNWRWRYIGMAARLAPVVFCPSQWLADHIAERFRVPATRMHAIQYGIRESWFEQHRARDSRNGGPLRVVLVNMKGVETALRAFAKVAHRAPMRLELYGVDKDEAEHQQLAVSLGIASQVEFRGFVANETLASHVAGADVLVHPAENEGFGQVLAEAAALGIPAIASSVDAIPEVVEDGQTGLLCPARDSDAFATALSRLIDEPGLRDRLGDGARARARERWRWDRVAARTEDEVYAHARRWAGRTGGADG